MELFDFKTNDVISIQEMETGKEKVKVVLNPAEFFVYDFANKNNIEISEVYETLKNADEYFHYYDKEGEFISGFFAKFASCFENEKYKFAFENSAEFEERPFNGIEKTKMFDLIDYVFYDIDELVIEEAIDNEEELDEEEIEWNLNDRIDVERGSFFDTDEDFLEKYVDKDFHKYFAGAEEAMLKMEYRPDLYIKQKFDFAEIAERIADGIYNNSDDYDY